jgi:hypothetical protein
MTSTPRRSLLLGSLGAPLLAAPAAIPAWAQGWQPTAPCGWSCRSPPAAPTTSSPA